MHIASRYGCAEIVKFLCEYGANLDIQDDQQETALHVASWHGFPEIVKYFCHFGCDVNLRNKVKFNKNNFKFKNGKLLMSEF